MKSISGVVSYTLKKLWLIAAILLVVAAVTLSLFRYALPHLDSKKHHLQDYVSNKYGIELNIGEISANWKGAGPSLVLRDVTLTEGDASPVRFHVDQVWVDINFWQSLSERLLISERFELKSPSLHIWADRLEGDNQEAFPVIDALKNLFLVQLHQFTVSDGDIKVETASQQQVFKLRSLTWLNEKNRHQGKGEIRVQELANNSASFIVELTGDTESLKGTLHARAESLDISPWVNEWVTTRYPLEESRANLSAWITINDNKVDHLHVALDNSQLRWQGLPPKQATTEISGGTIQALPSDDGWTFRVDQLVISQGRSTFVADLIGKADNTGNALINTVKPIPIQPLVSILPLFTAKEVADTLDDLDFQGELSTLQINWQSQIPSVKAKLIDVAWNEYNSMPGFSALDAEFYWHDTHGNLRLFAQNGTIEAQSLLGEKITNTQFDSNAYLYYDNDSLHTGWTLLVPPSQFSNNVVSFNLGLQANLTTADMQLSANVQDIALGSVPMLFPSKFMGRQTSAYLERAFSGGGQVEAANIIWSGKFDKFPFANNEGIFQASVDITNADFLFAPEWPALSELNMALLFENSTLYLDSQSGFLDKVALSNLKARIPTLAASSGIYIAANGQANAAEVSSLLSQTSSVANLGRLLSEDVVIDGRVNADLLIEVPFTNTVVDVSGSVVFNEANVFVDPIKTQLSEVSGVLTFENDTISAANIDANVLLQPIQLSLDGGSEVDQYALSVRLNGAWDVRPFLRKARLPLEQELSGMASWRADVNVALQKNDFFYNAVVNSSLAEVTSTLPIPVAKSNAQVLPLTVWANGSKTHSNISAELGDKISFNGKLGHKALSFEQALLAVGEKPSAIPLPGFNVLVNLPYLNTDEWTSVIDKFISQSSPSSKPLFPMPDRVSIEANSLTFKRYDFANVRADARQENAQWRIDLVSKQAIATANISSNLSSDGVSIFAEKLHLATAKPEQIEEDIVTEEKDPIPIRFKCEDCRIDDYALGKIDLELNPTDTGMKIERLNLVHPHAKLNISGEWVREGNGKTQLTGEFDSDDFGQFLNSLALNSGIKDSEADVDFAVEWTGSPSEFDVSTLNGNAQWALTDGYLTEISDKGSRIFTLFSLNSLVRKLSLDFRDVFAQGFFYDDIQGSLALVNGKAITEDTVVDGGAGEIEISGFSDLATESLNYDISFTPNVTGNLPFLVYFLANPPTAIAALALDQVLTSAKVISNINYQVSGTFADPVVTEVGRDSKDVELPAKVEPKEADQQDTSPLTEADLQRVGVEVSDG